MADADAAGGALPLPPDTPPALRAAVAAALAWLRELDREAASAMRPR